MIGNILWSCVFVHVVVGLFFLAGSRSRGSSADFLFFVLWPYFLWRHFWRGH